MGAITFGIIFALSIILCGSQQTPSTESGLILTPYIKAGRIKEAKDASEVDPKYFLNITSFSGFLTVDEKYDSNLFFWFFPKEDLVQTPWIIWLQGGPGATSLYGVFDEIGPFEYSSKKKELKLRNTTWHKEYSLLFIDNPVGAGYSFTRSDDGYATSMETYADHLYKALQQFLTLFPALRKAPLFIAGESYAGHYVPAFANEILKRKPSGNKSINLQGIMMGNPVIERENIANISQVFYQWGLIDSQGVMAAKSNQEAYIEAIKSENAAAAKTMRNKLLDQMSDISAQSQNYNVLQDDSDLDEFGDYLRMDEVMTALHVGSHTLDIVNHYVTMKLVPEFLAHVRPIVQVLLEHYRVMVYCGQLDLIAPCTPNAEMRRKKWRWSHRDEFLNAPRTPWWFNETLAGYVKSGGGFTEVLVRDAGHLVPMDKGAQAQQMVSYFIQGIDFDLPPNYKVDPKNTPQYTDEDNELSNSADGFKSGMIASIVFNVLLVFGIVGGILYYKLKMRRQQESWLYSGVNDDSNQSNSVLSLS